MADTPPDPANNTPASRFTNLYPTLTAHLALVESQRCLYCSDAPCLAACPTDIDVPAFIAAIAQDNIQGAARTIYQENILGGSCARVCPTEILCEQACVRNAESQPIQIARLQRYALDHAPVEPHPFERAAATGRRVAVVGAGPAGLSCAHQLSVLGNEVDIFEAEHKPGGLNEFGVARYKLSDDYAQKEIAFLLSLGGIQMHYGQALGKNIHLVQLLQQFDAVFLATGLGLSRQLGLANETVQGISNAIDAIKQIRQSRDLSDLTVPRRCIILGGGNTAVDIAVQIKLLGAESAVIVYRRGIESMSATTHELALAKQHQVQILNWAQPVKIMLDQRGQVCGMQFEKTNMIQNRLVGTGTLFELPADAIFKATGQLLNPAIDTEFPAGSLRIEQGRIWVDACFQTSVARLYAGGDCIARDPDLTVYAVQHGKLAARAMHRAMQLEPAHG